MKRFLRAAFNITLFQILLILAFSGIKYVMTVTHISQHIERSFLFICLGALLLFVLSVGITGNIENKWKSLEAWNETYRHSKTHLVLATFLTWGRIIPIMIAFVAFVFLIAPTTISSFLILLAGIVIGNIIQFVTKDPEIHE